MGVVLIDAETEEEVARNILRGVIHFNGDPWPTISKKAKSLVLQMLEPDPRRRLTPQEVLGRSSLYLHL